MNATRHFFATLFTSMTFLFGSAAYGVTVGQTFPAVATPHLRTGDMQKLVQPGQVTIVNFWATWCEACKVEISEFESKFKPLMSQPGFGLTLVSLDKEPQKARDWFAANLKDQPSFERSLLVDSEFKVADQLAVDAFPMTFVIGKDGRVRHVQRGYKPELKQTDELLKIAQTLIAE